MEKYYSINAEGCSIRCKLYSGGGELRALVLCGHGFAGHKDSRAAERFARRVLEKNRGAGVLCFDWPCHGDDVRKNLRLEDCDAYLRLVVSHALSAYGAPTLYGYAVSFGGYLFLNYISLHGSPFARIVLRCPAVTMRDVLISTIMREDALRQIEKGKAVSVGFDRTVTVDRGFLDELAHNDIRCRDFLPFADDLLILHGTKDEIVPFEAARAFAEENVIEFEAVEGADHRFQDPEKMRRAIERIVSFFGLK